VSPYLIFIECPLYCIICQQKQKYCGESCFSGTSGNSGGDLWESGSARLYFLGFQGLKNSRGPRGNGFPGSPWHPYAQDYTVFFTLLTLIGMREGTIHPLSFLDQILSAEFISKISKLFWRWKLTDEFDSLPSSLRLMKNAPRWRWRWAFFS
jgi:hypothetical protein